MNIKIVINTENVDVINLGKTIEKIGKAAGRSEYNQPGTYPVFDVNGHYVGYVEVPDDCS